MEQLIKLRERDTHKSSLQAMGTVCNQDPFWGKVSCETNITAFKKAAPQSQGPAHFPAD